ncbi:hypothetical protein SUGI_0082140 [Cryptomeria japonica]|nr:hypothetical protein SUGI_0082140 [Cryptomeria japonica]
MHGSETSASHANKHEGEIFRAFFYPIVQTMGSTDIGYQVGNEFVVPAFWPKVADQIFEIELGNLYKPLSNYFGTVIEGEEDSKDPQDAAPEGKGCIPMKIIWKEF